MAMGAEYSFELNSIETLAPAFFGHNRVFLGRIATSDDIPVSKSDRLKSAQGIILVET